jgi:hypothetical protein
MLWTQVVNGRGLSFALLAPLRAGSPLAALRVGEQRRSQGE